MARDAAEAGSSLKRRSPGGQARASEDNVKTTKEMNVMTKNSTAAAVATKGTVDFHGHALTVITGPAGEHLVAMRPICEAIGLGWQSQYNRIQRHPVLSTSVFIMNTQMPGDDQQREITCLPLDMLNGWLFGVDATRVKPEIRDTLIQYQRECFAALAAYWQQGEAINPRKGRKAKALPGALTIEQQDAIKALVKSRVDTLPHDKQGGAAIRCWSSLKSKFGCTYKEIPAEQFADALSLVARIELDGEYIPKLEQLEISYPATWWQSTKRQATPGAVYLDAASLYGMDIRSPSLALFSQLSVAGHVVEACRMEVLAIRHHLEVLTWFARDVQAMAGRSASNALRFSLP